MRLLALASIASIAFIACIAACSAASNGVDGPAPAPASTSTDRSPTEHAPGEGDDAGQVATLPPNGSKGCGASSTFAPGKLSGRSIDVHGKKRTYALSVPTGYDAFHGYALVFVFHGGGGTGAQARDYFRFESFAGDRAVFVYPDADGGDWQLDEPADDNDDVALFDALVEELGSSLCIDTTRIFATGASMGAYFSNQLGCRRGDVLRAIAPHAGGGPWEGDDAYDPRGHLKCAQRPVAAMVFIGLDDTNVDPSEGEKSLEHWSWANGCKKQAAPTKPTPCAAYQGCSKPVIGCKIPGLGHRVWDQGPRATWDFFAGF